MKETEIKTMKAGEDIQHRRYGICSIVEISYSSSRIFGVVIQPKTTEGKALLAADCGVPDIPLMEDSLRRLSPVVSV